MAPIDATSPPAFEEEIARLEAEMTRVVALTTTSEAARADLADRLRRLKTKAGMA